VISWGGSYEPPEPPLVTGLTWAEGDWPSRSI